MHFRISNRIEFWGRKIYIKHKLIERLSFSWSTNQTKNKHLQKNPSQIKQTVPLINQYRRETPLVSINGEYVLQFVVTNSINSSWYCFHALFFPNRVWLTNSKQTSGAGIVRSPAPTKHIRWLRESSTTRALFHSSRTEIICAHKP